jgi:hypothetical protein
MMRLALAATLLAGCRLSLDSETVDRTCSVGTSQQCLDAVNAPATLAWIETNIFMQSCDFSGCHSGAPGNESPLDLSPGHSAASLVNATSIEDGSRKLVVPNDVEASYLMLMLQDVAPANASPAAAGLPPPGPMPQSADPLCCQKLEVLERWINAGAPTS